MCHCAFPTHLFRMEAFGHFLNDQSNVIGHFIKSGCDCCTERFTASSSTHTLHVSLYVMLVLPVLHSAVSCQHLSSILSTRSPLISVCHWVLAFALIGPTWNQPHVHLGLSRAAECLMSFAVRVRELTSFISSYHHAQSHSACFFILSLPSQSPIPPAIPSLLLPLWAPWLFPSGLSRLHCYRITKCLKLWHWTHLHQR